MPDPILARCGMVLALLRHVPPSAALGTTPDAIVQPALFLVELLMPRCRALLAALVLIATPAMPGLVGPAAAFEAPPQPSPAAALRDRPPLAPGVAAFPMMRDEGAVAERINGSLAAAEAKLRHDMEACRAAGRDDWRRAVTVTSNGPRFLSFLVDDRVSGGASGPAVGRSALVFDLRTGAPIAWQPLLPARFAVRAPGAWMPAAGPAAPVESWPLLKLYRGHYPERIAELDAAARDACRDAVDGPLTLWPDTAAGALMLLPDHAAPPCAVPVALPLPILRELGAPSALLDGLGAR